MWLEDDFSILNNVAVSEPLSFPFLLSFYLTLTRTFEKAKNEKWFTKLISVFISNLCRPKHHHIFSTWVVERTIIRNFITNGHLLMHHFHGRKKNGQVIRQKSEILRASCLLQHKHSTFLLSTVGNAFILKLRRLQ